MTYEEILFEGKKLKEKGVEKFRRGDISSARDLFLKALDYLEIVDKISEGETEGMNLYAITLSNLCNCYNRQNEYLAVIHFATKGLIIKKLPKLYYFRAIGYANNEDINLAKEDLNTLKNILSKKERETDEGIKFVNQLIEKKQKDVKREKLLKLLFSKDLDEVKSFPVNLIPTPIEQNKNNPVVFLDLKIGNKKHKRIIIELFKDKATKICENFRCLCTGEKDEKYTYKGKIIHKVIKKFIIQGGDIKIVGDIKDSFKICSNIFQEESDLYSHSREGLLSMAINGKEDKSFQFFITLKEAHTLNKKNIVFGQILKGMDVIKKIEGLDVDSQNKPKTKVIISNCGEIKDGKVITPNYFNFKETNNIKNYKNEITISIRLTSL